jgi:hypothetical protein
MRFFRALLVAMVMMSAAVVGCSSGDSGDVPDAADSAETDDGGSGTVEAETETEE